MQMRPAVRQFALVAHVVCSVGWLGAVVVFLALAIVGINSHDGERIRAAYLAMDIATWSVIVPLSFASLATGLVQSVGTPWGLFRHYWVLIKLLLTAVATAILLLHTQAITRVAEIAAQRSLSATDLARLRLQLVVDAAVAILALLVTTILSVYKPRGLTRHGQRRQRQELLARQDS
jgi:hypothetical protein